MLLVVASCGQTACTFSEVSPTLATDAHSNTIGELKFHPAHPGPGETVNVKYVPSQALSNADTLVLRARLRSRTDPSFHAWEEIREMGVLFPVSDGRYAGSFQLPDEAVYGVFAVEDEAGVLIDYDEGKLWWLTVHDQDGRPLFEAIEQRRRDWMGRDAREVLVAAREMVEYYPNRVLGWYLLAFAEDLVFGREGRSARIRDHRVRLEEFDRKLSEALEADLEQAYGMLWYARDSGHGELARAWFSRLEAIDSGHPSVVNIRVNNLFEDKSIPTGEALGTLETLWDEVEAAEAKRDIADGGFMLARRSGEPEAILRWSKRLGEFSSIETRGMVGQVLVRTAQTIGAGIEWLTSLIDELEARKDEFRPLGVSREQFSRDFEQRVSDMLMALGNAQIEQGDFGKALKNLERAALAGWKTEHFEALAAAYRLIGDHDAAARAFAAASVDPGREDVGRLPDWLADYKPGWSEIIARVEAEMVERTLAESVHGAKLSAIRLVEENGLPVVLDQLVGSDGAVVVFWSRYCGPSVVSMPRVAELSALLSSRKIPLLAITSDPEDAALSFLRQQNLEVRVLFDRSNEAKNAFGSWATPQYFVLDGQRRIRFAVSRIEDLMRQVAAIRREDQVALSENQPASSQSSIGGQAQTRLRSP